MQYRRNWRIFRVIDTILIKPEIKKEGFINI